MALTVGSRIGPFEITGALGVGGMGEVHRAVDANLGRSVAIKVLPDAFAQDPERLARFEREAKTLASLNRSNIAQVFGLQRAGTDLQMRALVMELVEGPTLADRIAKGPIPLDEAVPIAIQITEALESAHDQGNIHRDLKPPNVKVCDDGTVKVLDFGLAKAMAPAGEALSGTLANSPTITSAGMTQAGVVLGTAAYMSPEQAKGRAVNQRADIWAVAAGVPTFAMSPDGWAVVYQASPAGQVAQLWLRRLDLPDPRPLATAASMAGATELSSQQPFWSPDSRHCGLFDESQRKLKIVEVSSGTVRNLCDVPGNQVAGTWSDDGRIVFASAGTGGIRSISANGGSTEQVTTLAAGEQSHLWPDLLPDGQHFVDFVTGGARPGIYLGWLSGQAPRHSIDSTFMARVAPPNHLLFMRDNCLVAQNFDSSTLALVGEPASMVDSIMRTPAGRVAISASRRGDIVYTTGDLAADTAELVWVSRTGVVNETVPPVPSGGTWQRLSGDGKALAYALPPGWEVPLCPRTTD